MVWVADPVSHESQDLTWYFLVVTSLSIGSLSGSWREGKCSKGVRNGGEVQKSPGPAAPPSGGKSGRNLAEL